MSQPTREPLDPGTTYAIDDGHGNAITGGLSAHVAHDVAARIATERGEPVYLYDARELTPDERELDGGPPYIEVAPQPDPPRGLVVTWISPRGHKINITPDQERRLRALGTWPRDPMGAEYCQVSHGAHHDLLVPDHELGLGGGEE